MLIFKNKILIISRKNEFEPLNSKIYISFLKSSITTAITNMRKVHLDTMLVVLLYLHKPALVDLVHPNTTVIDIPYLDNMTIKTTERCT